MGTRGGHIQNLEGTELNQSEGTEEINQEGSQASGSNLLLGNGSGGSGVNGMGNEGVEDSTDSSAIEYFSHGLNLGNERGLEGRGKNSNTNFPNEFDFFKERIRW